MRGRSLLLAFALVGSISIAYPTSSPTMTVGLVEVAFGALAAGSTVGLNATNGSASLAGAVLVLTTTSVLYLNNTHTSPLFVKLVETSASGLADSTTLTLGIDNGTATDQVVSAGGILTQTSGPYVQLPASSTNTLYVTTLVSALFGTGIIAFDVVVADDTDESATYEMKGQVTVT